MPSVDKVTCEVLARFAVAATSRQIGESLAFWRAAGVVDGLVLWVRDRPGGPLRVVWHEGVAADDAAWSAYARAEGSPIRLAAEHGTEHPASRRTPPLSTSTLEHWRAIPLNGIDGTQVGIVLIGTREPTPPRDGDVVFGVLGPALGRVIGAEHDAMKAGLFDQLAELTSDGVIVATPEGEYLAYNPALQSLSGWSEDEIRRHGWTHLAYPDPAVRADLQRGIAALVRGAPSEGITRTIRCKDGTDIETRIWSRLQPHPGGAAPSMLGVIRDVTSESIGRRRAIWEESHEQVGRLAGGIAHEFNNLLAAILGHAELIEARSNDAATVASARTIVQSAERGSGLSTQLLAFSGSQNLQLQPIDVCAIVEDAGALFRPRLPPNTTIHVSHRDGVPRIDGDAGQLQQILVNLLRNAADALEEQDGPRAIRMTVDTSDLPSTVRYRAPDAPEPGTHMVRIRVADSGPGFSEDALAHLFVPFFSGKRTGHGLGLAAVRGLVASHTGAVDVHNEGGGIVDLFFPPSQRPELTLPDANADSAGHERVWVVDDQPSILEFTQIWLTSQGYAVRVFESLAAVREAIGALHTGRASASPAVVVLDVVMPDGGGLEVRKMLRDAGLDVPILWTSGHAPESVTLPESDGAFLQKPFHGNELAAAIRHLIE
jgi:PAS domain S-box-containing protein